MNKNGGEMKKVHWIQFKTCDVISQLICDVAAKQVLLRKYIAHPDMFAKMRSTKNLFRGGKKIKQNNLFKIYFIGMYKIQPVLEKI
jgi:hypothetical protein